MADNKEKTAKASKETADPAGGGVAKPAGETADTASVVFSFYDTERMTAVVPDENQTISLTTEDGKIQELSLEKPSKSGVFRNSFTMPVATSSSSTEQGATGTKQSPLGTLEQQLETACDVPKIPVAPIVMLSKASPLMAQCRPYWVTTTATTVQSKGQDAFYRKTETTVPGQAQKSQTNQDSAEEMCITPVGLTPGAQTYTAEFHAHDTCFEDFLTNAKALTDGVEIRATALRTGHTKGSQFKAGTFVARTVDGYAEIPNLVPDQLYQLDYTLPEGYTLANNAGVNLARNLFSHGDRVRQDLLLRPCSKFPTRSIIFVQEGCPGERVCNLALNIPGVPNCPPISKDGVLTLQPGTDGVIRFQAAGVAFEPAFINLDENDSISFTVKVRSTQTGQAGKRRRYRFADEMGKGFAFREVYLLSQGGAEQTVLTDLEGCFEAEPGWIARAKESEHGLAVEAMVLTEEMAYE